MTDPDDDDLEQLDYDPDTGPDAPAWRASDEVERVAAVERGHPAHPGSSDPQARLHRALHVVVETQVADGRPASVRETLARLQDGGLTRHEAIHAIASVAGDQIFEALQSARPFDPARYDRELEALDGTPWKGSAPKGPGQGGHRG